MNVVPVTTVVIFFSGSILHLYKCKKIYLHNIHKGEIRGKGSQYMGGNYL